MADRILVTGCAGFIGSHLVEELLDRGNFVIGVDNLRTGKMENMSEFLENPNFHFMELDISKGNLHDTIDKPLDTVYHLAAVSSVKESTENPAMVHEINSTGTLHVLELARIGNARRFVYVSSAAVYGNPKAMPIPENTPLSPLSPYAASKMAGEAYVESYKHSFDLDYVILRYFNVYGPRQATSAYSGVISIFADRAVNDKPLQIEGNGEQTRSFIFVKDVVTATIKAGRIDSGVGEVFNICGTTSISILNLAKKIIDLSDTHLGIEHIAPRVGDVKESTGMMAKAQRLLEFSADVSLEDGLRQTLEWYREHN